MHGYYTFKAEEAGAIGVGVDKDKGSIDLCQYLAEIKRSQCSFMVYDINTPFKQKYDIIMALNVLHRTGQFEHTTANMFRHCNECILEVGESQLSVIISESVRQGFKLKRNIPSHRQQSCIGPRRVLHMERQNKD
ncbi:MAG: class I SAM-dependent methyltransferase [Pseudodesulfovibrio sp.]|nr:class I SAM-dependent methyltransferase [Pseudodesulfovibrio sp.]